MTVLKQTALGEALWGVANRLRGAMNASDFRDYMLSFLFLRYLSDAYEATARRELGKDCLEIAKDDGITPLAAWYERNTGDVERFETRMRRRTHYVIKPNYLWDSIAGMAREKKPNLLSTLETSFKFIGTESSASTFVGLFSEINLYSEKLGKDYTERNGNLCNIINEISEVFADFSREEDTLSDAYEYLIGQFAAGAGMKSGEFYTPQQVSTILSAIVTLDSHNPSQGNKDHVENVLDFACGSGSLLLNVRNRIGKNGLGKIYGQERDIATYNIARKNMLIHGVKDTEFTIFPGDTLTNEWDMLREAHPAKVSHFDAVVANPPFSYRWDPSAELHDDARFKNYGLAPRSAADFAFLLHGFHYLKQEGTMAVILPHGVLFRGGVEERIRTKLLKDGHIDTVIGLPANLFFSTGIPVCILVLKKCRKFDDILFINASEHFEKGKRQNWLSSTQIERIISTFRYRKEQERYSRRVEMEEIEEKGFNLSIVRYVSTAKTEKEVDLSATNAELTKLESKIKTAKKNHNAFLRELDLPILP